MDSVFVDIYFKDDKTNASHLTITKSWDDTLLGECNVKELCGIAKFVTHRMEAGIRVTRVNGIALNSPATVPYGLFHDKKSEQNYD